MVLDGLRGSGTGGRFPSTLSVIILFIVCFIVTCNWWSLSTENIELLSQVDQLQEKLKVSIEERDKYQTSDENLKERLRDAENKVAMMHVRLQNQNELKKENDDLNVALSMCKTERDSLNKLDVTKTATLEALRLEKDQLSAQISLKKQEVANLMADVNRTNTELETLKKTCNNDKDNNENTKDLLPNNGDISNELEENSQVNNEDNINKKLTNESTTVKVFNKMTELPDIIYNLMKDKNKKNDNSIN